MQIKRFEAKDMTEALRMIKREFGDDAVILSAKSLTKSSRILGAIKKTGVVITAATDQAVRSSKALNRLLKENKDKAKFQLAENMEKKENREESFRPLYPEFPKPYLNIGRKGNVDPKEDGFLSLPNDGKRSKSGDEISERAESLIRYHGFSSKIELNILSDVRNSPDFKNSTHPNELKSLLIGTLKRMISPSPSRSNGNAQRILSFVGGFGTGKTTTLVKVAARHRLMLHQKVGVISLDHYRVGNVAVLKSYADIMGIDAYFASSENELLASINALKDAQLICIDTPGIRLGDEAEMNGIKKLLSLAVPDEIHLVMSASMKSADLERFFNFYRTFSPTHLLFTRLDESLTFGNMVGQLIESKLPFSYVTNGVNIPEDIEILSYERLGDILFANGAGKNDEKDGALPAERVESSDKRKVIAPPYEVSMLKMENYVANRNSDILHHRSCRSLKRVHSENAIYFKSMEDALDKGFKPCRMCCRVKLTHNLSYQPIGQKMRSRHY